jgi:Putative transposase
VHVKVLARLFRGKMLAMLMEAHGAGQLTFFNSHAGLADKRTFKRFIGPLWHSKWVVYCKAPFAGPKQVLRYLSRYPPKLCSKQGLDTEAQAPQRLLALRDTPK